MNCDRESCWQPLGARSLARDIGRGAGEGSVIEHYGKPTAVFLPFADWEALQEDLDDLRAACRGQAAYEAWQRDPRLGRPWSEDKAEMYQDGLLEV